MQKDHRVAALERLIQHYEKCRTELMQLDQHLRAGAATDAIEDILAVNADAIAGVTRSLHVAYVRLEREQTRAVRSPERMTPTLSSFSVAV
jgi:hypothetical protein